MPAITGIAAHHDSPPDGSLNILKRYRLPPPLLQVDARSLKGAARLFVEKPLKTSGRDVSIGLLPAFMRCSIRFALQLRILRCSKAREARVNLFAARKNISRPLSKGLRTRRNCRIENL
ncbi:hypothetical protein LHFGNBLO_001914 [Mesorhizobium sp. AR10]|uniref:hypothetical protein n=1 Tax=Mesorhizobium sp. AR10 TaxID=2865839 RepID=UPI0021605C15|nr:hypothetical protein [Mesorhizobium sp. AR10]UVK40446.1 hypothetical protein LHFGNBLO_001914 [Mesorhizobium sp. AR10]